VEVSNTPLCVLQLSNSHPFLSHLMFFRRHITRNRLLDQSAKNFWQSKNDTWFAFKNVHPSAAASCCPASWSDDDVHDWSPSQVVAYLARCVAQEDMAVVKEKLPVNGHDMLHFCDSAYLQNLFPPASTFLAAQLNMCIGKLRDDQCPHCASVLQLGPEPASSSQLGRKPASVDDVHDWSSSQVVAYLARFVAQEHMAVVKEKFPVNGHGMLHFCDSAYLQNLFPPASTNPEFLAAQLNMYIEKLRNSQCRDCASVLQLGPEPASSSQLGAKPASDDDVHDWSPGQVGAYLARFVAQEHMAVVKEKIPVNGHDMLHFCGSAYLQNLFPPASTNPEFLAAQLNMCIEKLRNSQCPVCESVLQLGPKPASSSPPQSTNPDTGLAPLPKPASSSPPVGQPRHQSRTPVQSIPCRHSQTCLCFGFETGSPHLDSIRRTVIFPCGSRDRKHESSRRKTTCSRYEHASLLRQRFRPLPLSRGYHLPSVSCQPAE
jgi:hypothetical protein